MADHTPGPWSIDWDHDSHFAGEQGCTENEVRLDVGFNASGRECHSVPAEKHAGCVVAPDSSHPVCLGHDYDDYGRIGRASDARLIAAAPELLEAAEQALATFEGEEMCPNCVTPWKCNGPHISFDAVLRAAIAKAKGES